MPVPKKPRKDVRILALHYWHQEPQVQPDGSFLIVRVQLERPEAAVYQHVSMSGARTEAAAISRNGGSAQIQRWRGDPKRWQNDGNRYPPRPHWLKEAK